MATIKRFEDLIAWQKARLLCQKVRDLTKKADFSKDFKLVNQCRSSSGSIMDNIAEGFERDGNKEFLQFLSIAKGSAGELRSQIYRSFDYEYISKIEFEDVLKDTEEVSIIIKGLITSIQSSELKGIKYK